jgi:predicted amidohydrolase YtcJ
MVWRTLRCTAIVLAAFVANGAQARSATLIELADRRFRIEHVQHLRPADAARFAPLGVIASMQPHHAIDDGRWAQKELGPERIQSSYAWRLLLDQHAGCA